jgi:hypothetical protein
MRFEDLRDRSGSPTRSLGWSQRLFLTCWNTEPTQTPSGQPNRPRATFQSAYIDTIPGEGIHACPWFAMGEFSPTTKKGDCEEIANLSTAFGRRRRNWTDAHGPVPPAQVVDASCGNNRCIALRHSYLRPRVEQPGKYPKIADRVHRLRVGQHFDVSGVGTDERSRNRFRSGLYAAARFDRVSVRGLPDGSVRVTKVGQWSCVGASVRQPLRTSVDG